MTDQEINEAVARKLGIDPKATFSGVDNKTGDLKFDVPDYCHSIAAAWEILEFVRNKYTTPMSICLAFLKLP